MPGISGKLFKNILCYACKKMGHYSNECPGKNNKTESNNKISDNKGFSFAQCELNFTQMNGQLKPEWYC